jgi:HEAT repeat protein
MTEQKPHRLDSGRLAALNELATVAPERVVPLIAPLLGKMNRPTRRELRLYLSRATKKSRGRLFLSKALLDESLPMAGTVELLRAVQGALGELRGPAGVAFDRVLQGEPNLRTRYLLLESAAQLAAVEHERALHFLLTSLTSDPEPMMRTQAAMVSRTVPAARPWLMRALEDDNVRVRHAAAGSLAGVPEASPYLVRRLMVDDWPLVRASAARALGTSGPSSLVDEQLGRSLQDLSPSVRQWAVASLGARGASRYASAILEIAEEPREKVTIRIAAVHALGMMCASEAVDSLTILAKRSADPYSPEAISGLGTAALASLGRLQPKDLGKRLDPLLNRENISMQIRAAAQAALETTDRCPSK